MKLVVAKCPSCGAQIEVDENSNSTKCDYCNSQILVEEAIQKYKLEISGEVEVKNMPKIDDLLKLAERHFRDKEYEESHKTYSKVVELDPDNYVAVLRKGLSKALCTNYMDFEISYAVNGMKNAYAILEKDLNNNRELINNAIVECRKTISKLLSFAIGFYNKNSFDLNELINFNKKLDMCLELFEYLKSIVVNDYNIEIQIIDRIINNIDCILEKRKYRNGQFDTYGKPMISTYKIDNNLKNQLLNKKQKLITERQMINPDFIKKETMTSKENEKQKVNKTNNVDSSKVKSIICMVLCYLMVTFSILSLISSLALNSFLGCIMWIVTILIYIPTIKNIILEKNEKLDTIIIICRIVFPIIAICSTSIK